MRLVFIDDSDQRRMPLPRRDLGPLVAIGAVPVPDDQLAPFAKELAAIRTELGIPEGEEIKWKPKKGSFLADAGGELVGSLRRQMLEAAARCSIKSAVVVLDQGSVYKHDSKAKVGKEILSWLYERIEMCLRDPMTSGSSSQTSPAEERKQKKTGSPTP